MAKTAILLVSFGTTYPQTRHTTIDATAAAFQRAYPQATIFQAFTSSIVRQRIAANEGVTIDSPQAALHKIHAQGFTTLWVQSLHLIAGIEFAQVQTAVAACRDQFDQVVVGQPLLTTEADFKRATQFLQELHPVTQPHTGVLWMGHGTAHQTFATYACLDHMLMGTGHYLGAVESYPDFALELRRLKQDDVRAVTLQPFMLVAGNHAHHDMASAEKTSWQQQLKAAGIAVTPVLTGLGAYPTIQQAFITHLAQAVKGSDTHD